MSRAISIFFCLFMHVFARLIVWKASIKRMVGRIKWKLIIGRGVSATSRHLAQIIFQQIRMSFIDRLRSSRSTDNLAIWYNSVDNVFFLQVRKVYSQLRTDKYTLKYMHFRCFSLQQMHTNICIHTCIHTCTHTDMHTQTCLHACMCATHTQTCNRCNMHTGSLRPQCHAPPYDTLNLPVKISLRNMESAASILVINITGCMLGRSNCWIKLHCIK